MGPPFWRRRKRKERGKGLSLPKEIGGKGDQESFSPSIESEEEEDGDDEGAVVYIESRFFLAGGGGKTVDLALFRSADGEGR